MNEILFRCSEGTNKIEKDFDNNGVPYFLTVFLGVHKCV